MVKDNRRIAPPSNCTSPSTFETPKLQYVVNNDGTRLDGRKCEDLRPINLKPGVVPCVTGSAYLECGNTKVIASVNGPRDVSLSHKSDSLSKGQLFCEFRFATFSCKQRQPNLPTDEEMRISKAIENALEPVILLHKFPKARLDIYIVVLENDGAVISAAIICAGVALSNAGVEMYDLPVSCTLVYKGEQILIDPTAIEESCRRVSYGEHIVIDPVAFEQSCRKSTEYSKIILGMMPAYNSQVIFMENTGSLQPSFRSKALKTLHSKCQVILSSIKNYLKLHIKKKSESSDSEDVDMEACDCIKAAELKLFQPHKYMIAHLENNIRPDGRELNEFRPVLITVGAIGTANGSALVRLNNTSVLCGIKADLTNPTSEEPNKGFFLPNVTLTPICSNKFQAGPPGEQAQAYSQIIMDLVTNSDFIDLSSLCISEGKLSWCLFVEMICLSHDGNILDACFLAMMAALMNTKLPEVYIEDEEIDVTDKLVPLNFNYFVFPATFALVENRPVADPSEEEENLANGTLTVFVKGDSNQTVSVQSFGVLKEEHLFSSIKCARARYKEMKKLIVTVN